MVDEFDILSLLMPDKASDEAIAGSDPYLAIKQAPDLVSQVLLKESANPRHSLKDKVIAGLLTGVTGGALGGLSSNYQTRAKSAYQDALFGKGQADVLDDDIFAMADQKRKQASIFYNLLGEQQADEALREDAKVKNQLLGTLAQSDDPQMRDAAISQLLKDNKLNLGTQEPQPIGVPEDDITSLRDRRRQLQEEAGSVKLGDQLFMEEQKGAKDELAKLQEADATLQEVGNVYDSIKDVSTLSVLPGVSEFTNSGAMLGGAQAVIMGFLQKFAKGNPSDRENAVLQKAMPKWWDDSERIGIKKDAMLTFLKLSTSGMPYLNAMAEAGMDGAAEELAKLEGSQGRYGDLDPRSAPGYQGGQSEKPQVAPRKPGESVSDYLRRTAGG